MLSLMLLTIIGCGEKEEDTAAEIVAEESDWYGIDSRNNCICLCIHLDLVFYPRKNIKKILDKITSTGYIIYVQ